MEEKECFHNIDSNTFDSLLKEYPDVVPEKLSKLDEQRYVTIPGDLEQQLGLPSVSKDQLATLVDWKLSHGKFRPNLKGLVQQNEDAFVQASTIEAFHIFVDPTRSSAGAKKAINTLTKLKGIGPATASLVLSIFDPESAPFFSDELYRWCLLEDGRGQGWDREIKYGMKEYLELFKKVQQFRDRFRKDHDRDVSAVELEKVAYVLGKRAAARDPGTPKAGKKRRAETAPEKDLDEQPVVAKTNALPATGRAVPSGAEANPVGIAKAKKIPPNKQPKTKASTEMTAAASRPKRGSR